MPSNVMETRKERLARRIAAAEAELERLENLPEDDFEDFNGVIIFKKQFAAGNNIKYHYAAMKVRGHWYLSGAMRGGQKMTWEELLDFIGDGAGEPVYWASEWSELVL